MKRLSKFLFTAGALTAMSGIALADEPKQPDAPPPDGTGATVGGSATVGTDGAKVDANATVSAGVAMTAAQVTADTWPLAYNMRPQNAAKSMPEVTPFFGLYRTTSTDMTTGDTTSDLDTSLNVNARYGISDKLEVLFGFGGTSIATAGPIPIPEHGIIVSGLGDNAETADRFKGDLKLGAGFVLATGKLDVEVKGGIVYDLLFKNSAFIAGADVRFHINDKMWIGTPQNRPGLILGLTNFEFNGMEAADTKPLQIQIPVAFAFQATPELAIQANTHLLNLNLNDFSKGASAMDDGKLLTFYSQDEFGGMPLDVDVIFALNHKMDVVGNINFVDLKNFGDFLVISGGVNIRM